MRTAHFPNSWHNGAECAKYPIFLPQLPTMTIRLNGQPHPLPAALPLETLLAELGLAGRPVVIELDGRALPRGEHAATTVQPGAVIEVVTLAAGG